LDSLVFEKESWTLDDLKSAIEGKFDISNYSLSCRDSDLESINICISKSYEAMDCPDNLLYNKDGCSDTVNVPRLDTSKTVNVPPLDTSKTI